MSVLFVRIPTSLKRKLEEAARVRRTHSSVEVARIIDLQPSVDPAAQINLEMSRSNAAAWKTLAVAYKNQLDFFVTQEGKKNAFTSKKNLDSQFNRLNGEMLLTKTVAPKKSKTPTISADPQPRLTVRRSMVLGSVLNAERGRKKAFAKALGCTPSYVSQLISGKRPISEKAAKIADELFNLPKSKLDAPIHGHYTAKILKAVDEVTTTLNKPR